MTHPRIRRSLVLLIWAVAAVSLVVASLVVWGWLDRFELVIGPLVIRSQAGTSHPLPAPADGVFQAQPPSLQPPPLAPGLRPRNVVLIIGDGMGLSMVSGASALIHGPAGGLPVEQAPVVGLVKTFAVNDLATDSAAAGSALATGFKTRVKMISTLPDGREPVTLLEACRARGMAAGVVTTSGLMDATPASFSAHDVSRKHEADILTEQLRSGTEVMIGAAWGHLDRLQETPELAAALEEARSKGCTIVTDAEALLAASAPLVALLPPRPGSPECGGPALAVSARKALDELAPDPDGFLLLLESEETDSWGHENHIRRVVESVQELAEAISLVLAFAEQHPDTLVIVTADHDTGALGVGESEASDAPGVHHAQVRWTSDSHIGTWVPLFAFGPGAERFAGVLDNTEVPRRIADLLDLAGFPSESREQ